MVYYQQIFIGIKMRVDAIVLARGGSKGIPNKNLKIVNGKPLLFWTINQLKFCNNINETWISSDSDEILNYGHKIGAKKIKRPIELAVDNSSSESAWFHAVNEIENQLGICTEIIIGPQVTSPIRSFNDFSNAIKIFIEEKADSLLSVCLLNDYFIWKKNKNNFAPINYDFNSRIRRQEIAETYLENGSIYMFKSELIKNFNSRLGGKVSYYCMDKFKQFQIDEIADIKLCEAIMKNYKKELN